MALFGNLKIACETEFAEIATASRRPFSKKFHSPLSPFRYQHVADYFGNLRVLEVEIGSGRGAYLLERAALYPEMNFLGIEQKEKLMRLSLTRARALGLTNVRFIAPDAREVIRSLPRESVSVFHIYFPDPWFKKRHIKRRFVNHESIHTLHEKLIAGGLVELATDDGDYFRQILCELDRHESRWSARRQSKNSRLFSPETKTLFEQKYEEQHRDIFYLELRK
ncbi:MAG: tRNA (guanosine(46)-N7)-methyltransferase TrmB [Candidatus Omnitrophica bacterium]|nr:tRNA (guanosine(46)-N7)-methyltransferase TrmB [Candidatus Omnitrophota bacterium]